MLENKTITFEKFANKAAKKIEERKKKRVKKLYSSDLEEEIEIRGLSAEEIGECSEYSEDSHEVDKYTIYYASRTLKELASYMKEKGLIEKYLDVMNMFSLQDIKKLAEEVLRLSGLFEQTTLSEVDELKN